MCRSLSSGSHPYTQLQRTIKSANEYIPEIPNWENIRTFIPPSEFVHRKFEQIQTHLEKEFKNRGLRNVFYSENQYEYAKVHKCRRYAQCLCRVFVRDLLQIAYYRKVENIHKFLERYLLKPQVYLPFNELMLWLQLEVSRKNYKQAEAIVKRYIANTTNLIDDETKTVVSLDLRRKEGPKDPWKPSPEILDLKESEYYKLIDLYIFDIVLPAKGYDETKEILLKEIAMDKEMKLEYLDKLGEYYSTSIRETSLMHGTEAIDQLNKVRVKGQLNDRLKEIKSEPSQQGTDNDRESENVNPLIESTFLRGNSAQRSRELQNRNNNSWNFSKYFGKITAHVNNKTFAAIIFCLLMLWLWRGRKQIKEKSVTKFILKHVFGIL